jgi:gluconate kinase
MGARSFDDAMADYHHARDEHAMPIFEFTTQLATLELPPPDVQQVLFAVSQSRAAQDAFVSMVAGTMSPIEFFDPAHIGPIMGAAAAPAH